MEWVTGAQLYNTAPATAMPSTMPTLRMAASIPEATPRLAIGTLPMTALLFGLWKRPAPMPAMASRQATSRASEPT